MLRFAGQGLDLEAAESSHTVLRIKYYFIKVWEDSGLRSPAPMGGVALMSGIKGGGAIEDVSIFKFEKPVQ